MCAAAAWGHFNAYSPCELLKIRWVEISMFGWATSLLKHKKNPVKWRKISTTWLIILNGDTQPALMGLMTAFVSYGVDKAEGGGDDNVELTPAMKLATMMTMNKCFLLLCCLWWWSWQWWESDDVCAGCTAAEGLHPQSGGFAEREGDHTYVTTTFTALHIIIII